MVFWSLEKLSEKLQERKACGIVELYKVCNQVITPLPWRQSTAAMHERKVIPVDTKEFRYLRFRAIGNMEVAGQNGNHDGFGFSDFQDARPGYGYKSFIGKKAHVEHNCVPPGYLILMGDFSYKPIEEIEIGDEVFTHSGAVQSVTELFTYDETKELVRLKVEGVGGFLYFTPAHPIWIVSKEQKKKAVTHLRNKRNVLRQKGNSISYEDGKVMVAEHTGDPVWLSAGNAEVGDYVVLPYPRINRVVHPDLAGLDVARLLGYYAAEGNIAGSHDIWGDPLAQALNFSFHRDETEEISFVKSFFESRGITTSNRFSTSKEKEEAFGAPNCVIITVSSSAYASTALLHCGHGARHKFLSDGIMRMPQDWQIEFLKAYFTGDANIHRTNGIKGSTASKTLALQIQQMCLGLGAWCNLGEYRQHTPNDSWVKNSFGNLIYVFSITTHEVKFLFGDFFEFEPRATNCAISKTSYGFIVPIKYKEVIPYGGTVYNFEVEKDNSYLVHNIAVHNSSEGLAGSIGDLPDAYLNSFELGGLTASKLWKELDGSKNASLRQQILALPNQRDGAIEVMMRIDTKLIKSAEVKPKVRQLLDRIVRMIDTGQQLTCSMGANIAYSVCSTCGNEARFSNQYCIHLKPTHKGGITIAKANDLRDLLDKDLLRPEWLSHTVASKFDVNEILTGSSNKGIACRNVEINHEVSFFELSVVAMPAYAEAIVLEKLARKQDETHREHLRRLASEFGDDEVLELYAILQDRGLIGNSCMVG